MDYLNFGMGGSSWMGWGLPAFGAVFLLIMAWNILWKGLALWRAAKRGDMWWFIAFLFINTMGILEIIYLFVVTGAKLSDFTKQVTHEPHSHNS